MKFKPLLIAASILCLLVLLYKSCTRCGCDTCPCPPNINTYNNVTVLLDLSNRTTKTPTQVHNDTSHIFNILEIFEEEQRPFGFMASKSRLNIDVAFQPKSTYDKAKFGNALCIDMSEQGMNKPNFDEKKKSLKAAVHELYAEAVKSPTNGADIWSYFDTNLDQAIKYADTAKQEKNYYKNKLILITDGYLQFATNIMSARAGLHNTMPNASLQILRNKPNWESIFETQKMKLQPCKNSNIHQLEVLVLEVSPMNPTINTNEYKILEKFWATWFKDMNVEYTIRQTNTNPTILKSDIRTFLNAQKK